MRYAHGRREMRARVPERRVPLLSKKMRWRACGPDGGAQEQAATGARVAGAAAQSREVPRRSGRRMPSHTACSAQTSARKEGHRRLIKFTPGSISGYASSSASPLLPSSGNRYLLEGSKGGEEGDVEGVKVVGEDEEIYVDEWRNDTYPTYL